MQNGILIHSQIPDSSHMMDIQPDGGLPPPPDGFFDGVTTSIPNGPARRWDSPSSDEDSEEEGVPLVDKMALSQEAENGSESSETEHYETESECITEIYVPKNAVYTSNGKKRQSDVIPSVSSENLNQRISLPATLNKISNTATHEDIATNIDSGISNETSNVHSDGTVIVVRNRPLSVSSSSHYSSSYSCGSRGEIPSPNLGRNGKLDEINNYMKEAKLARIGDYASAAYAILLVLLTAIFTIFEISQEINHDITYKGFFIYLYGLGALYLIYTYATVVKNTQKKQEPRGQANIEVHTYCSNERKDHITPMIGSIFLRITVILFCVGSVIDNGLKFSIHLSNSCMTHFNSILQQAGQIIFMFLQVYFIFNNAHMALRRYPILSKFGVMHLLSCNLSIWLLNIITDIHKRSSQRYTYQHNFNYTAQNGFANMQPQIEKKNCTHSILMKQMSDRVSPYTFPCTLQYCILVTCLLYAVWRSIDDNDSTSCSDCKQHDKETIQNPTRTIDCSNTSLGLFMGITTLVTAIACLIVFFILTTTDMYDSRATLLIHVYQIAMYFIMTVVAVVILLKLRTLDYNQCRSTRLEDILIGICLLSLFAYDLVNVMAGIKRVNKLKGLLILATSLAEIMQSILQIAAMTMALKLCSNEETNSNDQPGRQFVTFMIVANISLWVISLFNDPINQGFASGMTMYGNVKWSIILNIVSPLVIFYHLFSASCFVDVWYNAYRNVDPVAVV